MQVVKIESSYVLSTVSLHKSYSILRLLTSSLNNKPRVFGLLQLLQKDHFAPIDCWYRTSEINLHVNGHCT